MRVIAIALSKNQGGGFLFQILVSGILLISLEANATGFRSGSEFRQVSVSGIAHISCHEGSQTLDREYECFDLVLTPTSLDQFVGPQGVRADTVTVSVTQADGTIHSKSYPYDDLLGRSRDRFNLGAQGLFSAPLLALGLNQADFILTLRGTESTRGQFSVLLSHGAAIHCDNHGKIDQSSQLSDCDDQYLVCSRFFQQTKNCRP